MRLVSISLGNRGDLELRAVLVDFSKQEVMYQLFANGLKFCETPFYEDASAVLRDVFDLNTTNNKENLQ
jgi:hypothetical protein